ncbi:MAG: ATP-binding protein [Acidimicrobiia bacterium]|nr:ATP-binding protein [Acidimicrobiia bacterium]
MSARVAVALVQHIRELPGKSKFLLIEGCPADLAQAMVRAWGDDLPTLLVGGEPARLFGKYALGDRSVTQIRNLNRRGVCIVACEGFEIPDWQSISKFPSITPSDLLTKPEGLVLLANSGKAIDLDGPLRHVRQAILAATSYERPTAFEVASFFDALAEGMEPQAALPLLRAYADPVGLPLFAAERVLENFRLARKTFSEQTSSFNDIRRRADRVLSRNPGRSRSADEFMRLLQTANAGIFSFIDFDEARTILEDSAPTDLTEAVRTDLNDRRRALQHSGGKRAASEIPWESYEAAAEDLRAADVRKAAARTLLEFNVSQDFQALQPTTKKKLEAMLRDRSLSSAHASLEELLVRGILGLQSRLARISLFPAFVVPLAPSSRTSALRMLVVAAATMRLRDYLTNVASAHSVKVDGALLKNPREIFGGNEADTFAETFRRADVSEDNGLPALTFRLSGQQSGDTIELRWQPSIDDIATLRAAWLFDSQPAASLELQVFPSATAFCASSDIRVRQPSARLKKLRSALGQCATATLDHGFSVVRLRRWVQKWRDQVDEIGPGGHADELEELGLIGAVHGRQTAIGLTAFSPLKAEWLANHLDAMHQLCTQAIVARSAAEQDHQIAEAVSAILASANSVARLTAGHYPAFVRVAANDDPLLPVAETQFWSVYAAQFHRTEDPYAEAAIGEVIEKLLTLQPEVASHLKCLAYGPNAASVLVRQTLRLLDRQIGKARLRRSEVICIGDTPDIDSLLAADEELSGGRRHLLQLRHFPTFESARQALGGADDRPLAHLALVTGLSGTAGRLSINSIEIPLPEEDQDVLLTPRTSLRPGAQRRFMLVSPTVSSACGSWLRLMTAIEDRWPVVGEMVRVPELGTSSASVREYLRAAHNHALWVATVDRYASREALERALGSEVAILHQERRLSGESPVGIVISQKSGGSADRAIARSLKAARLLADDSVSSEVGRKLREVASQGYGILALEAATTGAGINELVAHVCAFSLLGNKATPWPLPPDCRVLLISLDEYASWFPSGKRADLLALAIDTKNVGIHVAAIEVKARRADNDAANRAAVEALDQLRHTLSATRYATHYDTSQLHTRIWLNRVAEAAYSVAREIGFRLDKAELEALEAFRKGPGNLEWAAMGLVFGPNLDPVERHYSHEIFGDRVPIAVHNIKLTPELLLAAVDTRLTDLRTVQSDKGPLPGGRIRRRPEKGGVRVIDPVPVADETSKALEQEPATLPTLDATSMPAESVLSESTSAVVPPPVPPVDQAGPASAAAPPAVLSFQAPLLGWIAGTSEAVMWNVAGPAASLQNGHMEVWGSSGAGKTQFIMGLLLQLSQKNSCHFGVTDFKNDYGGVFLEKTGTSFFDLWDTGAPYNPLALLSDNPKAIETAIIELRDIVDVAARSFTVMGHRQQAKLHESLEEAYAIGRREKRWPTLATLNDVLDKDLRGIIGDLTSHRLFTEGPPLGEIIYKNAVFGLSRIPGNGLTTVLAGGFILSALLLKIQNLEPVPNTVRYIAVVDEAHRVAKFKAIDTMIREGRSKGLAVILATQQPNDLPDIVGANALTKICFRLPDATMAKAAAKRLNPNDRRLAEQIKTLGVGEAFVSLSGQSPQLLRMVQLWRDSEQITS